jgi:S1-C subfamily serine protease
MHDELMYPIFAPTAGWRPRVELQVKVFATIAPPNYALPWQNHPLKNVTGSGFIISGNRILTNAHVVADQAFVMVRKHGSPERFAARVLAAGHDCDLALLAVEDPSFFDSTLPVQFGGLPRLEVLLAFLVISRSVSLCTFSFFLSVPQFYPQDEVSVVGYPTGGDNISVTRGIVSRVEPQQYAHGTTTLLAIQIDAAINPGNSGGPAFQGKKVVGVAFQNLQGAENIGFVIPTTIIDHFLTDVERNASKNRPHAGFSSLGLHCQAMENINLRLFKKMKQGQVGFPSHVVSPSCEQPQPR